MNLDNVSGNGDHDLEDRPEYTLIEYAYYKMAIACGIIMNDCRIYSSFGDNHFMTKRFDRVAGKKVHMQSLGALAHISYQEPGICGYELAARYMQEMGLVPKEIEQFYRRMVFNCLAVNQDDHVKNISFLMDRSGEWTLSPAYDITFSYDLTNKWLRAHQMTVNGKSTDISLTDMLIAGQSMGLKEKSCKEIINEIGNVTDHFYDYASDVGIQDKTISCIQSILNQNKV